MGHRIGTWLVVGVVVCGHALPACAAANNSLMDVTPDGARLIVANPDNGSVSVVDTGSRRKLFELAVGDKPEGVSWVAGTPVALVALYDEGCVLFVDAEKRSVLKKLRVAPEPYGIVTNRAGTLAWVTHEYPGLVNEIDLQSREVRRELKAGRFVRGLALSPDEKSLFVMEYYTAVLNQVELSTGIIIDSWKGHTTDNLCRHVAVHPRRPKAYLSHIRSRTQVASSNGSIFPHLSICDLVPANGGRRRISVALDTYNGVRVVTNPWEAALSPDGTRLYTIYAGTDDMNVSAVVDDDYNEVERIDEAVRVGKNPRAVRVSPDGKLVYVYNALDFSIGVHDAETLERLATIPVCAPPRTAEWVRGKVLFNTALHPMSGRHWIACASCHPDGHTDGRVWQNPEGLRKTPALMGLAHTHPLHWSADRDEVQDFEYTIRGRLMQGAGLLHGALATKRGFEATELEEHLAGRSKDLDALAVYCNSFDFTLSPHIPSAGHLSPTAERGKTLFLDSSVGCAQCHSGPYYTDSRLEKPFLLHDVGTGKDDPTEKMGPRYDTPTLLGVYRTAPYLHHGKATTLRDVLTTCNTGDRHGRTSHLKSAEIDDLVEFLKALPYEIPPDETPNAVKYRVPRAAPK
jgi:YVTN family beta-propeller protein